MLSTAPQRRVRLHSTCGSWEIPPLPLSSFSSPQACWWSSVKSSVSWMAACFSISSSHKETVLRHIFKRSEFRSNHSQKILLRGNACELFLATFLCCIWQSNDYIKHTNTVSRFVAEDGHFGTKITCHNVQKQENILVFLFHPRIKFCLPFIHIIRKFQLYFHMTWSSFMAAFLKHHCCASFPLKTNSLHGVEGTMQPSLRE